MHHYLGLYRHLAPFPTDVVIGTLSIMDRWLPDFFPVELPVTRKRSIRLSRPTDYDPELLPSAFKNNLGETWTPFEGGGGVHLRIADNRAPSSMVAANAIVTFRAALPPLACLEGLLGDLIDAFQPDGAHVTDSETPGDKIVKERWTIIDTAKVPPWFSWLTWLNPALLEAAGPEALARLSALCHVRPLAGGAIVRLQDEPTRGDDPECSRRRQAAEDAFGLDALHRRFPRDLD